MLEIFCSHGELVAYICGAVDDKSQTRPREEFVFVKIVCTMSRHRGIVGFPRAYGPSNDLQTFLRGRF